MKVRYSFEVGGVLQPSKYQLEVSDLPTLLASLPAGEAFVQVGDCYVSLCHDVQMAESLEVVIRVPKQCECQALQHRVQTVEEEMRTLRNSLSDRPAFPLPYELDIAVLFAAPLVKTGVTLRSVSDSDFNFERERGEMLAFLRKEGMGVSIHFDAATMYNLVDVLSRKPKVLQIECHGVSKTPVDFHLAFEDSTSLGLLEKVTAGRLQSSLEVTHEMVVLINACHSEAIAHVFLQAGVRCAIAVHRDCRVLGQSTRPFALELYKALCLGATVEEAFNQAKSRVTMCKVKEHVCCCAHFHTPTCTWYKHAWLCSKNLKLGHQQHTPDTETCSCELPVGTHKANCTWARTFREQYCPLTANEENGQFVVCCCRPELPHDEGSKYVLLPERGGQCVLFSSLGKTLIERDPLPLAEPPLVQKKTLYRHLEIQTLANLLNTAGVRGAVVWGLPGVGKTTVVKRAAQYLFERRKFKQGVVYVDLEGRTSFASLSEQVASTFGVPELSDKALCRLIKDFSVMVILDGIDTLIEQNVTEVKRKLKDLVENTHCARFVAVTRTDFRCDYFESFHLQPLSKEKASKMLVRLAHSFLPADIVRNSKSLIRHKIWEVIQHTPEQVQELAQSLVAKDLDQIVQDIVSQNQARNNETAAHRIAFSYLSSHPNALAVFRLIGHFPHGVNMRDLRRLGEKVAVDWESGLEQLKGGEPSNFGFLRLNEEDESLIRAQVGLCSFIGSLQPFRENIEAAVQHLATLARAITLRLQAESLSVDLSNLLLFNAVLDHGLWASRFPEASNDLAQQIANPRKEFESYRSNFVYYFEAVHYESLSAELKSSVEELMICTLTNLILLDQSSQALELALGSISSLCERFSISPFCYLIDMFVASVDQSYRSRVEHAAALLSESEHVEYQGECELLLGLLHLKPHDFSISPGALETHFQTALEKFQACGSRLGAGRASLALAEWYLIRRESDIYPMLTSAKEDFTKLNQPFFVVRTLLALCQCHIDQGKYQQAKGICEEALAICHSLRSHRLEKSVKDKLAVVQTCIQEEVRDQLTFLQASPFALITNDRPQRLGLQCYFSNFQYAREHLRTMQREVHFKCCPSTRTNLEETLANGSRFMVLICSGDQHHLWLEGSDGAVDFYTPQESTQAVDVVVLGAVQEELAQTIARLWKAVLLVYFPTQPEPSRTHDFDLAVERFGVALAKELEACKQPAEAYEVAKDLIGKAEDSPIPQELLATHRMKRSYSQCNLANAPVDLSPQLAPTNLSGEEPWLAGRHLEMLHALQALQTQRCVHVIGAEGLGKTAFLRYLGGFLHSRGAFPDGVFLLNVENSLSEALARGHIFPQQDQRVLLLLDDCDSLILASSSLEFALHTYTQELNLSIVFASVSDMCSSPAWVTRLRLKPLDLDESVCFLQHANPDIVAEEACESWESQAAALRCHSLVRGCRGVPASLRELEQSTRDNCGYLLECESPQQLSRSGSLQPPGSGERLLQRRKTLDPTQSALSLVH